jgi:hypothetical protein
MSGISTVVGLGVAGTPQGGLFTVQGDPAGTPIPVTLSGGGGGPTSVQGTAANGAAPSGNPVWVGGYDGALIRAMLLDTSGRSIVVGPTPVASAVVTNPLTVGGVDSGSLVRLLRLDQSAIKFNGRRAAVVRAAVKAKPLTQGRARTSLFFKSPRKNF